MFIKSLIYDRQCPRHTCKATKTNVIYDSNIMSFRKPKRKNKTCNHQKRFLSLLCISQSLKCSVSAWVRWLYFFGINCIKSHNFPFLIQTKRLLTLVRRVLLLKLYKIHSKCSCKNVYFAVSDFAFIVSWLRSCQKQNIEEEFALSLAFKSGVIDLEMHFAPLPYSQEYPMQRWFNWREVIGISIKDTIKYYCKCTLFEWLEIWNK